MPPLPAPGPSRGTLEIPLQSGAAWTEAQPAGTAGGGLNQSWDGAPGLREKPGVAKDARRAPMSSGALIWGLGMEPSGKGGELGETVMRYNFQSLSDSWVQTGRMIYPKAWGRGCAIHSLQQPLLHYSLG